MAHILLAEDSNDIAQLISEFLKLEGHEVEVVGTGREAVDMLRKGIQYDVIITDLIMPELDGFGILRYVLGNSIDIPVIVLSGGGVTISSGDALKAVEGMAAAVIQKPVAFTELSQKINGVLS